MAAAYRAAWQNDCAIVRDRRGQMRSECGACTVVAGIERVRQPDRKRGARGKHDIALERGRFGLRSKGQHRRTYREGEDERPEHFFHM